MTTYTLWLICVVLFGLSHQLKGDEMEQFIKSGEKDLKDIKLAETMDALKVAKSKHPVMMKLFGFLSSTPYIKRSGLNAVEQLMILKEIMKETGLTGRELFKNVTRTLKKGAIFKSCSTRPFFSDDTLPFPVSTSCCPIPNVKCRSKKTFRTIDGSCNCLSKPNMGRSNRAYSRVLPPEYGDELSSPRRALSGNELPSARAVSNSIYQTTPQTLSPYITVLHMTIGQVIDHDTDRTPVTKFMKPDDMLVDVKCGDDGCQTEGKENMDCFPIPVPKNDPFFNKSCLMFVRSQAFMTDDCKVGPREQPNVISSWLDASHMYGSTKGELEVIKDPNPNRGRMLDIMNPMNPDCGKLIPQTMDASCRDLDDQVQCFAAGDARRNEQVGLTAIHITKVRLHNYIEGKLHGINPHWDGERLFQESRRIVIGLWQNIIYNEYLPVLLGPKIMKKFDLNVKKGKKCYKDYDCEDTNADVSNQFATASFRFGHSQVGDSLKISNADFSNSKDLPFSSVLFRPRTIYEKHFGDTCGVEAILLGHADQPTDRSDRFFTHEMSRHLFTDTPPKGVGGDLPALNTQRGRDHGLPGYTRWRRLCGLHVPKDFSDMKGIPTDVQDKFAALYEDVHDVDLFPAAMAEAHEDGAIVGPTFACLLAHQFRNLKKADRFWFERCHRKGFTKNQMKNIREYTLGRYYCDTLQGVKAIQPFPMMLPISQVRQSLGISNSEVRKMFPAYKHTNNERLSCDKHPEIDFSLWKD